MAKMKCRCGKDLEFEINSEKFIVFCNACYTNYVMKKEGNNFKIELVYYFPDD
jgi:Zn finger protein HypA/HybF involved in hydrogenase expression